MVANHYQSTIHWIDFLGWKVVWQWILDIHCTQWFSFVANHWQNDPLVINHLWGVADIMADIDMGPSQICWVRGRPGRWWMKKKGTKKTEGDFLTTKIEMLKDKFNQAALEVWMSNGRSWYFGPELSWFEVLQFVSSEQCMVIPQIYNCKPC